MRPDTAGVSGAGRCVRECGERLCITRAVQNFRKIGENAGVRFVKMPYGRAAAALFAVRGGCTSPARREADSRGLFDVWYNE